MFSHMVKRRELVTSAPYQASNYLDLEISNANRKVLDDTTKALVGNFRASKHELMKEAGGEGASLRLPQRYRSAS
jgi:hypothetical protein